MHNQTHNQSLHFVFFLTNLHNQMHNQMHNQTSKTEHSSKTTALSYPPSFRHFERQIYNVQDRVNNHPTTYKKRPQNA